MELQTSKTCEYRPGVERAWGHRASPGSILVGLPEPWRSGSHGAGLWAEVAVPAWFSGTIWSGRKRTALEDCGLPG